MVKREIHDLITESKTYYSTVSKEYEELLIEKELFEKEVLKFESDVRIALKNYR
jgi:hypothetical protein